MKILLSPFTKPRRDGKVNAKDYPYWEDLINLLAPSHELCQIGIQGEKQLVENAIWGPTMAQIHDLMQNHDTFIAVDNFFQHFMNCHFPKTRGIVLYGPSNPELFGYKQNLNLYADKRYFRRLQFDIWETCEPDNRAHVEPYQVITAIRRLRQLV